MNVQELIQNLNQDPRNVGLLARLAAQVEDRDRKVYYYRKILQYKPGNRLAIEKLRGLGVDINKESAWNLNNPKRSSKGTVLSRLQDSREELLDLSLRNKILNYRTLKTKGVKIVDEIPKEVFRILVQEARTMSFLPAPDDQKEDQQSLDDDLRDEIKLGQPEESEDPNFPAERHRDNHLQTPYSSAILQKRLLNTYYAARTSIQEQGVNTLYLALGMLNWYESPTSDRLRKAPLILIPIELSRTSVQARFRINYSQEEISENLSLNAKWVSDFGLALPEFPEIDDLVIPEYFQKIRERIGHKKRWEIDGNSIVVAFFSYAKYLMFNDLNPDNWPEGQKPQDHPIIKKLLDEGFDHEIIELGENEFVDDLIDLSSINHVVNADSSQSLAIRDVSQGKDIVIQGPPGTGKSQTITNMIADAIKQEKTVLFVSEKMAALEVVKRRLDSIGLGKACLELHSRKTKKKLFLEELNNCLSLGEPNQEQFLDLKRMSQYQAKLNRYAKAVNNHIGNSEYSPFELYGKLIKLNSVLASASPPKYNIKGITNWSRNKFESIRDMAGELELHLSRMGPVQEHPFSGSKLVVFLPHHKVEINENLLATRKLLDNLFEELKFLQGIIGYQMPSNIVESKELFEISEYILSAPSFDGINVDSEKWTENEELIRNIISNCKRLNQIHLKYDPMIKKEVWGKDIQPLKENLIELRSKWWWFFSFRYRNVRKEFLELLKTDFPNTLQQMRDLIEAIQEEDDLQKQLVKHHGLMKDLFTKKWNREESDLAFLSDVTIFLTKFHEEIAQENIPFSLVEYFTNRSDPSRLRKKLVVAKDFQARFLAQVESVLKRLKLADVFGENTENPFIYQKFEHQALQLNKWIEELDRLQEIIVLKGIISRFLAEDLTSIIKVATQWNNAGSHLVNSFEEYYFQELLNKAMKERPELSQFDGNLHEHDIEKYCDLDTKLLEINRIQLARKHWNEIPHYQAAGQLGILTHEFAKKRRHKPIRRLMREAGNVIQTIKPIFMMSPISIAMFLPPGIVDFDLVIFDEASQVEPVDAFGAIIRGKQVVIAGDDKQLPPTTFFSSSLDVDEDETDSITIDLESILGLSLAEGIPQRMLRWHYRSEHESLIAVSNREFYNQNLVIFPSPDKEKKSLGLVYHYLQESTYDRGKSRTNIGEAKAIAQAVIDHARNTPELTLGVAAFSSSQKNAIRDQLEILRRQQSEYEKFFKSHPEEEFFIKNLENVQGDERDIIFISVGYGWSPTRKISMNFGPLNRSGGERRLNVLITRARKRCEIFTNLLPEDIDLSKTKATGVKVLKRYLKYAKDGDMEIPTSTGEGPDSPFEAEVASALIEKGYRIEHQVGAAGFFIDLAVIDKEHPGQYLLGIECDGASYHSAKSARDRDRLRQYVLEDLGWIIHRIWSTDWFRNPDNEIGKLIHTISDAKDTANNIEIICENTKPAPSKNFKIKREEKTGVEKKAVEVIPYKISSISISRIYSTGLHRVSNSFMANHIKDIVAIESPVHKDEVARRIRDAAGISRFGRKIKEKFEKGIRAATNTSNDEFIIRKGNFLWAQDMITPQIRSRENLPQSSRDLKLIAPGEIQKAILEVIKTSYGITEDELPSEVCSLFGFGRTSSQMRSIIKRNIQVLLKNREINNENDFLIINDNNGR